MKEEYCFWCNSEIKPPYALVCTYTNNTDIISKGKRITYKTPNNLEKIRTVFCKNCKKETTIGIKKEEMTEEIKEWLIDHGKIRNWLIYLQAEKWFCHNCGREIFGNRLFPCNEPGAKDIILKERCRRCGQRDASAITYKPLKKWFKSSGKSKRSNKNYILEVEIK